MNAKQAQQVRKDNPDMMVELMFPSKYLKAADFKGKDVTLTIKSVQMDELESKRGKEWKYIVHFEETDKMLVMNVTNARSIAKALNQSSAKKWAGSKML